MSSDTVYTNRQDESGNLRQSIQDSMATATETIIAVGYISNAVLKANEDLIVESAKRGDTTLIIGMGLYGGLKVASQRD